MIIGQANLLKKLDSFDTNTLPRAILLIGEEGCGKKTVSRYLASKLNLKLVDIKEKIEPEQLVNYQYCLNKTLFVIDLRNFLTKEGKNQNNFLKFIEEPGKNAYIMLLANSEVGILPTILNRCAKFYFESYTIEDLKKSQ
jgi:DNA polymerase III gamma/tau subunit